MKRIRRYILRKFLWLKWKPNDVISNKSRRELDNFLDRLKDPEFMKKQVEIMRNSPAGKEIERIHKRLIEK